MRRFFRSPGGALSALIAIVALSLPAFGQSVDGLCKPDCPTDNFSTPFREVLELPGGCWVRVTWASRRACNMWYDVGIVSIEPLTDGCGGKSVGQLMNEATIALLTKNPMNFPPRSWETDTCVANWRVIKGACWRYEVDSCGDSLTAPCPGTTCCLNYFEVCVDSAGKRTVTPFGGSSTGACDTVNGCKPVCGSFGGINPSEPEFSEASHGRTPSPIEAIIPRREEISQ